MTAPPLLDVAGLTVSTTGRGANDVLVREVSITVNAGEIVGTVGESGCGKSTLLRAVAGVLPSGVAAVAGTVHVNGHPLAERKSDDVAMIFQDPMTGLNPTMTVGQHVSEVPHRRDGLTKAEARSLAVELLGEVGIDDAEQRLSFYPHQLSGGLRQRVLIAAALSGNPKLLLCDEPTTALDVTVQARLITLLRRLVTDRGLGILYVTHDLPLLGTMCDRISVMYAGQMIERGTRHAVLHNPSHPYTAALLAAAPRFDSRTSALQSIPGRPPTPADPIDGCRFAARCAHHRPICDTASGLGPEQAGQQCACVRSAVLAPLHSGGTA